MQIFITWAGENRSHGFALALREWLCLMFQTLPTPFVSSEDIDKGTDGRHTIAKKLEECNFGIACLTPENLKEPWLMFECGALSKAVAESRLWTVLLDELRPGDVKGPLERFQHTILEKEDFFKLIMSLNESLQTKIDDAKLRIIFEAWWPKLQEKVEKLPVKQSKKEPVFRKRNTDDMLYELLELTRSLKLELDRRLPTRSLSLLNAITSETTRRLQEERNNMLNSVAHLSRGVDNKAVTFSPDFRRWIALQPGTEKLQGVLERSLFLVDGTDLFLVVANDSDRDIAKTNKELLQAALDATAPQRMSLIVAEITSKTPTIEMIQPESS